MLTAIKFAIGVGLAIVLPALFHFGIAMSLSAPLAPTYQQYNGCDPYERANELREFWISLPFGKS